MPAPVSDEHSPSVLPPGKPFQSVSCSDAASTVCDEPSLLALPLQLRLFEHFLAKLHTQGTIDGGNGSNACTIISVLIVFYFLRSAADGNVCPSDDDLCALMREGNHICDSLKTSSLLAADEVLDIPGISAKLDYESFVRPYTEAFDTFFEVLLLHVKSSAVEAAGCVFVITPYTFSVCCYKDT